MRKRQGPPHICAQHPDSRICEGINGFKDAISPIISGIIGGETATSSLGASATPPPPPETVQPVPITSTSTTTLLVTSTSLVLEDPTLAPALPTALPTAGPGTGSDSFIQNLPTEAPSSSAQSGAPITTLSPPVGVQTAPSSIQSETSSSQELGRQGLPAAVVAGVAATLATLVIVGIALWYSCLRKRNRRRSGGVGRGDRSSASEIHRRVTQASTATDDLRSPVQRPPPSPVRRKPVPVWRDRSSSVHTSATSVPEREDSLAETGGTGTWPEPLSPRPVMKQTIQRVNVPSPVDASSFYTPVLASQERGSSSGPASRRSTRSSRNPGPGSPASNMSLSTRPSASGLETPKSPLSRQPGTSVVGLQPVSQRKSAAGEAGAVGTEDVLSGREARTSKSGGTWRSTQYTVRRSPLAQNPFVDPVGVDDEETGDEEEEDEDKDVEYLRPGLEMLNTSDDSPPEGAGGGEKGEQLRPPDFSSG